MIDFCLFIIALSPLDEKGDGHTLANVEDILFLFANAQCLLNPFRNLLSLQRVAM